MFKISFKSATICVHTGLQSATPGTDRGANLVHRQFLPLPLKGALERVQTSMIGSIDPCLQYAPYGVIHNVQVRRRRGPIRRLDEIRKMSRAKRLGVFCAVGRGRILLEGPLPIFEHFLGCRLHDPFENGPLVVGLVYFDPFIDDDQRKFALSRDRPPNHDAAPGLKALNSPKFFWNSFEGYRINSIVLLVQFLLDREELLIRKNDRIHTITCAPAKESIATNPPLFLLSNRKSMNFSSFVGLESKVKFQCSSNG